MKERILNFLNNESFIKKKKKKMINDFDKWDKSHLSKQNYITILNLFRFTEIFKCFRDISQKCLNQTPYNLEYRYTQYSSTYQNEYTYSTREKQKIMREYLTATKK